MQPGPLPPTATDDGVVLRVEHSRQLWALQTFQRIAPWALVGTLGLMAVTWGVGAICLMAFFPLALLTFLGSHLIARLPRAMEFSSEGIRITGPQAPPIPRPTRLVVRGSPGSACELWTDTTFLMKMTMRVQGPWTPNRLTHFAKAAAQRLGVPLVDQRDLAAWDKWSRDPVFRASSLWDNRKRQNAIEFPHHCAATPARSTATEQDHHGMTVTIQKAAFGLRGVSVRFTMDTLHHQGREIPLESIVRAGPHYVQHTDGSQSRVVASFQVLTHDSWTELFELTLPHKVGPGSQIMAWLSREIALRAADSRARSVEVEGTSSEIPPALRALRER